MNTTTIQTKLSGIPAYIAAQLAANLDQYKRTEAECHAEGNTSYNAIDRMRLTLDRELNSPNPSVNSALEYTSNYSWLAVYLGIEGRGLFIDEEVKNQAKDIALEAIRIFRNTILS